MSVYNLERKEGPVTFDSAKPLVVEIGLGCYFWLALCTLLSGALYPALEVGTACQIPLTLSCDAGLLLGFAGCLAVAQSGGRTFGASSLAGTDRTSGAVVLPFLLACTTSASILLRAGMLFEDAAVPMIAGDVLLGASLAAAGYLWWLAFSGEPPRGAFLRLVRALLSASIAFVALSLMPRGILLLCACLVAPVAMGLGLAAQLPETKASSSKAHPGTGEDKTPLAADVLRSAEVKSALNADAASTGAEAERPAPLPRVLSASIVISVFVADLLLSLFPVSLFSEASPLFAPLTGDPAAAVLGNLTEPAFIAALLIALFSVAALLLEERGRLRLPLVCSVGFFAVAVGFVTFPYHLPGGAPIGIAEAGRVIILVFIIMALLRYYQGCPPQAWLIPLARLACLCALAMAVADVLVMTLYLNPALDLFDFTNRTIFGGVGVLVLVALLLGPMPHVYEVVRRGACHSEAAGNNAENTDEGAESAAAVSLQREELAEAHLDAFASTHRLSPREREILGLISKGRDVPYIEQELVLSKSTVKTHIRHIYEKCEVSSRQALIDLLQSHPGD